MVLSVASATNRARETCRARACMLASDCARLIEILFYFYSILFYFNYLKTVTHSAKLVYKGPSIYKIKAKNLRKKERKKYMFKKSIFTSV